jgi:hypothetical protein
MVAGAPDYQNVKTSGLRGQMQLADGWFQKRLPGQAGRRMRAELRHCRPISGTGDRAAHLALAKNGQR